MNRKIPNAKWLALGIAISLYLYLRQIARNPFMGVYLIIGIIVACVYLIRSNPKDDGPRYDIAIGIPVMALMWPVMLVALYMLTQKEWNEPAKKLEPDPETASSPETPNQNSS